MMRMSGHEYMPIKSGTTEKNYFVSFMFRKEHKRDVFVLSGKISVDKTYAGRFYALVVETIHSFICKNYFFYEYERNFCYEKCRQVHQTVF